MSEQEIIRALTNLYHGVAFIQRGKTDNNMDSSNTGIAILDNKREVVYTIMSDKDSETDKEIESIAYTDGKNDSFSVFTIDRPFIGPGVYRDISHAPHSIKEIKPIPNLEKKLAKLAFLKLI